MRNCLVCGVPFTPPPGHGRRPETCSARCAAERKRQKRDESRLKAVSRAVPAHAHGTSTGYTYYKCPCAACRKWAREYKQSQRAAAKATTTPPRVRSRTWIFHPGSANRGRTTSPTH